MSEPKITTPNEGEKPLFTIVKDRVFVMQLPDDPLAIRVSLGQPRDGSGPYCVFRGPRFAAITLLKDTLAVLEVL